MYAPRNILHISPTPLVAAPGKIAHAQRMAGHRARALLLNDYPQGGPLAGKFIDGALLARHTSPSVIDGLIARAQIIHVHNSLPRLWSERLLRVNPQALYVYHVHSPLREGPLFLPQPEQMGLPFRLHLCVGQYQPRHYPDYLPVPNIIIAKPHLRRRRGERLRVLFSPSHQRAGRWNAKASPRTEAILTSLHKQNVIEAVRPEAPLAPEALMQLRRTCHASIDEIATGAFHQVSLEALCAGNIAINRADYFCRAIFAQFADGTPPPFLYADDHTLEGTLRRLAVDPAGTAELQRAGHDYFCDYLLPKRLARVYDHVYSQAL